MGAIVRVDPEAFAKIAAKVINPLIVISEGGWLRKNYQYPTSYKGLIFFADSFQPIYLGGKVELVKAGTIWVPN